MSSCWWVNPDHPIEVQKQFASNACLDLQDAECVSKSPLSRLFLKNITKKNYYVKTYHQAGRKLRRLLGRSRLRAEWENLFLFASLGIPIPEVTAFGEKRGWMSYRGGILVTQSIDNVRDLAALAKEWHPLMEDKAWLQSVLEQVACHTQSLHQLGFIHNDLKWRNILVTLDQKPIVYFIDCPSGKIKSGWFKRRGIIKDLACLDKVAKYCLSRRTRLHFLKSYFGNQTLTVKQKKMLSNILKFFEGRE